MSQTKLLVWGNNNQNLLSSTSSQCLTRPEQIIFPFEILKIAATQKHISFITTYGDVFSYGSNSDGRLGIGTKDNFICHYKNPVKVNLPGRVKQIKSGFSHVCVQLENNDIYAWGLGQYGSLGIGQFRTKYTPTKVLIPPTIKQISCGAMHTAFTDFEGNAYMCGSNEYGELGVKNPDKVGTPILVSFQSRVKQVACGVFYTLLLTEKGDVYGMGNNKYAQLGLGHKINQFTPTIIQDLSKIVKIQAGYHSGAINNMGQLFLWGSGSFGQFLRPRKFILNSPLSGLQIRGFFGIAVSESQNKVFIWGNNTHGQLGNGGYISYKTPTQMKHLSNKIMGNICCGVNFAICILQQGQRKAQRYEKSYSPISKFTSRREYNQKSLQSSPNGIRRHRDLQISKRRHSQDVVIPKTQTKTKQRQYEETNRSITSHRNYENLFLNLSKDYEVLAKRFRQLESQISQRQVKRSREVQINSNESHIVNESLKQEIWILEKQLIVAKQQRAISHDQFLKLQTQVQLLLKQNQLLISKNIKKSPTKSPSKSLSTSHIRMIDNQKIDDLRKIVEQKEDLLIQMQMQKNTLSEKLKEESIYVTQIQAKHKALNLKVQDFKLQNLSLRQLLLKSESNIASIKSNLRQMVPEKQFEKAAQQIAECKTKNQELEDKCTKYDIMFRNQKASLLAMEQERTNLYSLIQELKNTQKQNKIIHDKKIEQQKNKISESEQKIKGLQVQVKFEKDFATKLQQKSAQMDRLRNQACQQLQKMAGNLEKQKKRRKQLQREVDRFKTTQNQLKLTKQQLQKQRVLSEEHKDKVIREFKKKDQLIKQMQNQMQSKELQYTQIIQDKQTQIQTLNDQVKKGTQKYDKQKQQLKKVSKQLSLRVQDIQNLKDELQKLQRKLKHTKQLMQKETNERQELAEQVGSLKRDQSKSQFQKEQFQRRILELEKEKIQVENALRREKENVVELNNELNDYEQKVNSMKQQNNYMRSELEQANAAVDQSNKISEQLSNANKQFAQNEQNLNKKVQQLESKIYQLQDENRSYTPRYDALIERNRELDQRNKQLSEMVNKAIQIQAENYKTNILKQVEISTNQIINDAEDEKKYKQRFNRKAPQPQYAEPSENQDNSFNRTPEVVSRVRQQPYTKYMNEKIQVHRRRVSESAQKLASILDLQSGMGSAYTKRGNSISKRGDDQQYEKINSHMESLKSQKEAFMGKINSFASKMKLL